MNLNPLTGLKKKLDFWFLSVKLSVLVSNQLQQEEAIECLVNKQSSLIMYSNSVCLAAVCLSDDGIALSGIQLCSIFSSAPDFINLPLLVCFTYHISPS